MPRVTSTPSVSVPAACSAGALAELLGVTERTIVARRQDGRLPKTEAGQIDLRKVVQAGMAALAAQQAANAKGEAAGGDLDSFRARESRLRGDKLELINAQLRADLVPAEEMEAVVGAAFDAVRQKVLAVPAAYGPRLATLSDPTEVRELLTKGLHDALGDLAGEEVIEAVKDRTRRLAGRDAGGDEAGEEAGPAA